MKGICKIRVLLVALGIMSIPAYADNQTPTTTTIQPSASLPFRVVLKQAFTMPVGIHSGVYGVYKGLWVFIGGRTNGLHGFDGDPFPPDAQNTSIYVVDPVKGKTYSRELSDLRSGLDQKL